MDRNTVLKLLSDFVSIQSVSADSKRYHEILKAVDFLQKYLKKMEFEIKLIKKDKKPPLIIASKFVAKKAKTIGIYAHYDVQPEDPVNEWKTAPFTLTIKNGKMYGRGVADDKGHLIQNLVSINQLINTKKLKNNIVFIFEGEEETGSMHFESYVSQVKNLLAKVDVFYVTDVGMHKKNVPQIFYGLRGLVYFELKISTGQYDLHSGIYGNRVLNPGQVLADLFTKIKDIKSNRILIPHFYDEVRNISSKELTLLKKVEVSDEEMKKEAGTYTVLSYKDNPSYLISKIYPSFDVHGIQTGYTGEGSKTVIPHKVITKFSFRLVENQVPDQIEKLVKNFIKKTLQNGIKYEIKTLAQFSPFYTGIGDPYIKQTAKVLSSIFKNETLFNRAGGSIPAAEILQRLFKKPVILTGFTLPDEKAHSPNENFDEEIFWKGIEALKSLYSNI